MPFKPPNEVGFKAENTEIPAKSDDKLSTENNLEAFGYLEFYSFVC